MESSSTSRADLSKSSYIERRRSHWQQRGQVVRGRLWLGGGYHARLRTIYRDLIPEGSRVLELGCGNGDLLAAVNPAFGVGVDFNPTCLDEARRHHPQLTFLEADVDSFEIEGVFDFVIISDLIDDLYDVETTFRRLHRFLHPGSRIVLNSYSRMWQLPLALARRIGLARPLLPQNWLSPVDVHNLLHLTGFETMRCWGECLLPIRFPLVTPFANRIVARIPPFTWFDLTNLIVSRPQSPGGWETLPAVTVVVPARNEAGNIREILQTIPEMGAGTEIIFVEGHSTDNTYEVIVAELERQPRRNAKVLRQPGSGKADAVRHGFVHAQGDILMILDADLTVEAAALPRFFQALTDNRGEFINGVRLVYPMADHAMQFFNLIANKSFSLLFSWILGQTIKDTLCGTKVISRANYLKIVKNRSYFGDFDPFGDFDLLFGAAKLNLRIVDVPIRYQERTYGSTNIKRWRHGLLLLRMLLFGLRRLKFR